MRIDTPLLLTIGVMVVLVLASAALGVFIGLALR
jgi:hypothetical protein